MNITLLKRSAFNVRPLKAELDAHPLLWDLRRARTEHPRSPHRETSDIWVRFPPLPLKSVASPCVWYPEASALPSAREIAEAISAEYRLPLEGVLITRIPAHKCVYPHIDTGWHAECTEKFAVCVRGGLDQRFCFEDAELATEDGALFWFDNSRKHWVVNDSDGERITLIVCLNHGRLH